MPPEDPSESTNAASEDNTLFTTEGTSGDSSRPGSFGRRRPALLVQRGPTIGDWYLFEAKASSASVGRGDEADFQLKDGSVSRVHARFTVNLASHPPRVSVQDLGSTNGTRVNGKLLHGPAELEGGDLVRIGDVVLRFRLMDAADISFQQDIAEQVQSARKDTLTGLFSRRYLDEQLPGLVKAHRRNNQPLSMMILDLDHFKSVNDAHGHLVGDEVLSLVASTVQETVRTADSAVRYGGEEFCVILPGTELAEAAQVSERLRAVIEAIDFSPLRQGLSITSSFGVATLDPSEQVHEWLRRADLALYAAKHGGRNRVRSADGPVIESTLPPEPVAARETFGSEHQLARDEDADPEED